MKTGSQVALALLLFAAIPLAFLSWANYRQNNTGRGRLQDRSGPWRLRRAARPRHGTYANGRAATLISQFKEVAVDQSSLRRRRFALAAVVRDLLATVAPRLKQLPHRISVEIAEDLIMDSYPGPLGQVLTNLIENSLVHAYSNAQPGHIQISTQRAGDRVHLRYQDDGSGLGLYIVYGLVSGHLGGTIQLVDDPGSGTCFALDLPAVAPELAHSAPKGLRP